MSLSINVINHNLTTVKKLSDGTIVWSNPAVDCCITSKGDVIRDGNTLKPYKESNKLYSVNITSGGVRAPRIASFSALYSRMVAGIKLSTRTIMLRDSSKGYVDGNVDVVSVHYNRKLKDVVKTRDEKLSKLTENGIKKSLSSLPSLEVCSEKEPTAKKYYVVHPAVNKHITEDGAVFPTRELAEWHQEKVSKGKGNAQVVLDFNGGYVLAEQIYLQEVVYNAGKPYQNFVDVMQNNSGTISQVSEEKAVFERMKQMVSLSKFGLEDIYDLECSVEQAEKINTVLLQYSEYEAPFIKAVDHIKYLVGKAK